VDLRQGELENLPIDAGELDAAMLSLVLHYSPSPGRALAEVGRVLRPGGRVLVVDMLPHDRQDYQQQMGHVWLGFSDKQIGGFYGAGFSDVRMRCRLIPMPGAPLFAAAGS
jgi:ArsR family transcriptional regulator